MGQIGGSRSARAGMIELQGDLAAVVSKSRRGIDRAVAIAVKRAADKPMSYPANTSCVPGSTLYKLFPPDFDSSPF
jgi:hypothetical protein